MTVQRDKDRRYRTLQEAARDSVFHLRPPLYLACWAAGEGNSAKAATRDYGVSPISESAQPPSVEEDKFLGDMNEQTHGFPPLLLGRWCAPDSSSTRWSSTHTR